MSSISEMVDNFDIGFFSTHINSDNSINLEKINTPEELSSFNDTLKEISREAYTPPSPGYVQLDSYRLDENNNQVTIFYFSFLKLLPF
jgi:hypothetical protein